ncbi:MAG: glycosyltransferase [Clostridia bacterium]|nr:glycosyltransferase [Clostridia bacterium]
MEKCMNSPVPAVSVIMPAYNAEQFIEDAVRSVLDQTITDLELIVIDDCSRDGTRAVLERLAAEDSRIVFIKNPENMGVAKTRNRGLDICRGRYVAFIDSDDVWHSRKLECQISLMEQSGAELSYCSYSIIDENGEKIKKDYLVPEHITFKSMLRENVIGCSTAVITARAAEKYRFNPNCYHEDFVLWLELLRDGYGAVGCREVLADWRLLRGSRSFDKVNSAKKRWYIYRKHLKLSFLTSAAAFVSYGFSGIKKHFI